ncbi:MAG: hypothetical protein KDH88_13290 [Chromatiales bacterium]|nr:hypothetical protein [Chromatiales bacterium]
MSATNGRAGVVLMMALIPLGCAPQNPAPGVIYARFDLECGSKTYTLSTGNSRGECRKASDGKYVLCSDGAGNEARANCEGGCVTTKGAGSCSVKPM